MVRWRSCFRRYRAGKNRLKCGAVIRPIIKRGDNMNPNFKKIIQKATFNEALFAEHILYNGIDILAIVKLGETESQMSPGFMKQTKTTVIASNGYFAISIDDVPRPKRGDTIVYNGKRYDVAGIEAVDSVGGQITVRVTTDAKGWMNR